MLLFILLLCFCVIVGALHDARPSKGKCCCLYFCSFHFGKYEIYFPNFQTCSKLSEMLAHPKVGVIVYIVVAIVVFMVSLNVL